MVTHAPQSSARRATQIGLAAAAVGIAVLYVSGTAMPIVPPGLVLLVAAAVLVGVIRQRWTLAVGLLVVIAEFAGFFASGSASGLTDLDPIGVFAGTWIRLIGLLVASAAGVVALRETRASTSTA